MVNSSNNINCGQRGQIILATTKMQGLLKLFLLACLFTISLAQCSGSFSNATQQVTLNWTVIDSNTVNFVYTAPSTATQYTALAFTNQLITSLLSLVSFMISITITLFIHRLMLMLYMLGRLEVME